MWSNTENIFQLLCCISYLGKASDFQNVKDVVANANAAIIYPNCIYFFKHLEPKPIKKYV